MQEKYDVIIVGSGAAGLFHALSYDKKYNILIITKDKLEHSDSFLAQGGIATLLNKEDYTSYYEDTMKAGHYKNNPEAVEIMIHSSPKIIQDLINYGVDFSKGKDGLAYTREGGHSKFRILYHEDITGKEITGKLLKQVQMQSNITLMEHTTMVDIIEEDHGCKGIIVKKKNNYVPIYSKIVVLATGGIGGLFLQSTNYPHLTGDALAISLKHHIELQDIHYIQIHPTTLYSKKPGRRFLISESVRGEGAILLNPDKQRFCDELQPRDKVVEAIRREKEKFNSEFVYLSFTHMSKKQIQVRFPNIYQRCLEEGYAMEKDLIPITPAQHYFMGGIKVNMNSKTTMDGLYAIGETSCNGVHGANRLASNSLLESLVFAKRSAIDIQSYIDDLAIICSNIIIEEENYHNLEEKNKQLILNEIKRKDPDFYDKWCK